jgi:DNA polymerase elongation subunit (family B)
MSPSHLIALPHKETIAPYKAVSFDIEASSSHGDFPLPVKTYKKLANDLLECLKPGVVGSGSIKDFLISLVLEAFFPDDKTPRRIDCVYPKKPISRKTCEALCIEWVSCSMEAIQVSKEMTESQTIEAMFLKNKKDMEGVVEGDGDIEAEADSESEGDDDDDLDKNRTEEKCKVQGEGRTIVDVVCDLTIPRDAKVEELSRSLDAFFPSLEGDKVTFIGSTFMKYGEKAPSMSHCIALNTCDPVEGVIIESYATEKEVLLAWTRLMQRENPDIVLGYNIFGFDYLFLFRRAEECGCLEEFLKLSKTKEEICAKRHPETMKYQMEQSSIHLASGQHDLSYIKMPGRLQIDLYNFYRREDSTLDSFKLDFVAGTYIQDEILDIDVLENENENDKLVLHTKNLTGLLVGSYIHLKKDGHSKEYLNQGEKFRVVELGSSTCTILLGPKGVEMDLSTSTYYWCLAKDDVTPQDIFRLTHGSAADRATIAKYCVQDCNLVHYLFNKSDILTGYIEMAKICSVPMHFLVMRGQGIKLTSFVAKCCRDRGVLLPTIDKGSLDEGYEGAIVLPPKTGLYTEDPIACVDYASLYPSSMISENLSHDTKVWTKEYDLCNNLLHVSGITSPSGDFVYDNLPGRTYVDIPYDTYKYVRKSAKAKAVKVKSGYKVCRFIQPYQGEGGEGGEGGEEGQGIMPAILKELLSARKRTRAQQKKESDPFMKQVLNQRQLGYKVTANSLYGQCGAKTSTFYEKDIAACTTATGRKLLTYAQKIIETCYHDRIVMALTTPVWVNAEYIYGDTDSVFFTFHLHEVDPVTGQRGSKILGKEALEKTIVLAKEAGHLASSFLKEPHDLEYEKTFMPFCLMSKKRYVGRLFDDDHVDGYLKQMGIVLKRKDNAPLVKDVYGGIVDIFMEGGKGDETLKKAIHFLCQSLQNLVDKKIPIEKLIITKSLRSGYKDPTRIAHKVLADRITERDPGNKPASGDRIPFVYIVPSASTQGKGGGGGGGKKVKLLQGEKIELPSYVIEHKLCIDYSFYITNQLMKPIQQLFALVVESLWKIKNQLATANRYKREVKALQSKWREHGEEKVAKQIEKLRCKEVKSLLFDAYILKTTGQGVISFASVKK